MKSVFVLFFLAISLFANSGCYSIQIASFFKTLLKDIKKENFPKECRIAKNKKGYSILCECEKSKEDALKKLHFYKKFSKGAFIVKSYFESSDKNETKKNPSLKELFYDVFIYTGDLKNAYKVIKKALKENPSNLLWRRRLADVLLWMGKQREAFREYKELYRKKKSLELEKIVEKLSISTKDYKDAYEIYKKRFLQNPTKENMDKFVYVAEKLGRLQDCAKSLDEVYKKRRDAKILKKSADLYFLLQKPNEAKERFLLLYRYGFLDTKEALNLAKILFFQKNYPLAMEVLKQSAKRASIKDKDFWKSVSLFYLLLGKKKSGMEVLKRVCLENRCQKDDYQKLISYYFDKNASLTSKISLKAFRERGDLSFLFAFVKEKIKNKKPKEALEIINSLDENQKEKFQKNALFWLMEAKIYEALKKRSALKFYKEALKRDPESIEILGQYAFYLITSNNLKELKKVLSILDVKEEEDLRVDVLKAMINYKLGKFKRALYFYKKALKKSLYDEDLQINYALLLIDSGEKRRGLKLLREIFQKEKKELKKNPLLYEDRKFIKRYLRVALYFLNSSFYENLLKKSKKVLTKEEYDEFLSSFLAYKKQDERLKFLVNRVENPKVWLRFYLLLKQKEPVSLKEFLYSHAFLLPPQGRIEVLRDLKQIGEAKERAFRALEQSPKNRDIYKLKYELDTKYANRFQTSLGYEKRGDLKERYLKVSNLSHLMGRYYLGAMLDYIKGKYVSVFDEYRVRVWLKILQNSGYFTLQAGYRNIKKEGYWQYFTSFYKNLKRVSFLLKAGKNAVSNESIDLLLKAKKDYASLLLDYLISNRLSFSLFGKFNKYYLKEGQYLGNGGKITLNLKEKIKTSYPSISLREFITFAKFKDEGVLNLPKDYKEGGVGILIGDNTDPVSYSWRPYLAFLLLQNSLYGFSYQAKIGASGRFLGDDNLDLSLSFSQSSFDSNDRLWLFEFKHNLIY